MADRFAGPRARIDSPAAPTDRFVPPGPSRPGRPPGPRPRGDPVLGGLHHEYRLVAQPARIAQGASTGSSGSTTAHGSSLTSRLAMPRHGHVPGYSC